MAGQHVVIVGSGPAGLAAAIELGSRGIACTIIEREARIGHAPRAKTTHTRTREHMRRWGIAETLAAASPFGVDYPSHVLYVTKLGGKLIHRFEHALQCAPGHHPHYSEHGQWIPQYKMEAVLRDHALGLPGVTIRMGVEFVACTEHDNGLDVRVRLIGSSDEERLTADFLIGADGARSSVRDSIGAKMQGVYGLSRNYNIIFRAPGLSDAHPHGPGIMYCQVNDEVPSLIGPMDVGDLWYFMPIGLADGVTYSNGEAQAAIRRATGIDLPYEIVSSDVWIASSLLADRYRRGRIFLVGDACHLHPPFGGFGMNMGIADSVDIGWKIAAVLQGWGGETLLESYQTERRPAHEFVLQESEANLSASLNALYAPGIEDDTAAGASLRREARDAIIEAKTAEFYALGVVLGYGYQGSPVIVDDGSVASWTRSRVYVPRGNPGCLAPHHWMADGRSLYDLFGKGFTLLVLGDIDTSPARAEAAASTMPLTIVAVADEAVRAAYGAPLVLIRPDQHIAWRGEHWPESKGLLAFVTGQSLAAE